MNAQSALAEPTTCLISVIRAAANISEGADDIFALADEDLSVCAWDPSCAIGGFRTTQTEIVVVQFGQFARAFTNLVDAGCHLLLAGRAAILNVCCQNNSVDSKVEEAIVVDRPDFLAHFQQADSRRLGLITDQHWLIAERGDNWLHTTHRRVAADSDTSVGLPRLCRVVQRPG